MRRPTAVKHTSHSLRIGAHTEQILVDIRLEVCLARFVWGPNSQDMSSLYFDRTIKPTAASYRFFGLQEVSSACSRLFKPSSTASARSLGVSSCVDVLYADEIKCQYIARMLHKRPYPMRT